VKKASALRRENLEEGENSKEEADQNNQSLFKKFISQSKVEKTRTIGNFPV